jgi:hypothetical protein
MTLGITTKMLDLGRSRQREIQKQGADKSRGYRGGHGCRIAGGTRLACTVGTARSPRRRMEGIK